MKEQKDKVKEIFKKYKKSILIALTFSLLGILVIFQSVYEPVLGENGEIVRNETGDGKRVESLTLEVPELELETEMEISVSEKRLGKEDREALFQKAIEETEATFLGANSTIDNINQNVVMAESYADGLVSAEWELDSYREVDPDGTVHAENIGDEGVLINATVLYTYDGFHYEYCFPFRVCKKEVSKTKQLLTDILEQIHSQDPESEAVVMPQTVDGYALQWKEKKNWDGLLLIFLGLFSAVLLCFSEKEARRKAQEKRKKDLTREYPELVSKLTLLMGVGMTPQAAWKRIVETYEKQLAKKEVPKKEAYTQMQIALREMEDGLPERVAYEKFAYRCELPQYKRLAALLEQNLKKGSYGMLAQMDKEAQEAFEMRKKLAKKYGEEAGTKLLGPMLLMLGIVMVILMVPAFLSMKG